MARRQPAPSTEDPFAEHADRTRLVVQARDPYWLHAYWELRPADLATMGHYPRILRVYELSGPPFDERAIRRWFEVSLTPEAADWFLEVRQPSAWWGLELGVLGGDGRFLPIVRSNVVETPADRPSEEVDEAWGVLEGCAEPYRLAGPGTSSPGSLWWSPGRASTTR